VCAIRGAGAPVLPDERPLAQHRVPMASYEMMDLREEINCRRGGGDSHTTIERNHERRQDIEGRNLEKDFDLHAPVGERQVTHALLPLTPREFRGGGVHGVGPTPAYGGLAAQVLAPPAREVRWDG
jgi:hypothetical protein